MLATWMMRMMEPYNREALYRVFYSTKEGHFFMSVEVIAQGSYEAMRWFDQNPDYFQYRRRSVEEVDDNPLGLY